MCVVENKIIREWKTRRKDSVSKGLHATCQAWWQLPEPRGLQRLRRAVTYIWAHSQGFASHTQDGGLCSFVFPALHSSDKRVRPWLLYLLCSHEDYSYVPSSHASNAIDSLCLPNRVDDLHPQVSKGIHSWADPWSPTRICGMTFTPVMAGIFDTTSPIEDTQAVKVTCLESYSGWM